jgi:AcrR family transcriptional regulator
MCYGGGVPKVVDHAAYRVELLSKSFEIFAERGYHGITMRELAKELGVSTGTLYHYFATKEEVFQQLMSLLADTDINEGFKAIPADGTTYEKLHAIYMHIDEFSRPLHQRFRLTVEYLATASKEAKERYRANESKYDEPFFALFPNVDMVALELLEMSVVGLVHNKEVEEYEIDFKAHAKLMAQVFDANPDKKKGRKKSWVRPHRTA